MKRIHFNVADFPNFIDALVGYTWSDTFVAHGFKTHQFEYSGGRYGKHSLIEEYTWFVLRWS
jgi:hypothetical protein